jgi:hypothetical protein
MSHRLLDRREKGDEAGKSLGALAHIDPKSRVDMVLW